MNKHLLLALLFLFFTHLSIAQDLRLNTFIRTNITPGVENFFSNPSFVKYKQNIDVLTIKAGIALRR
jgi:hypothetical protein